MGLPVDCSRPQQIPQPRTFSLPKAGAQKRKEGTDNRSLFAHRVSQLRGGVECWARLQARAILVDQLRNNRDVVAWGVVLGHLKFGLALREFPAIGSSLDPDPVEEVGGAHALEHQHSGLGGEC